MITFHVDVDNLWVYENEFNCPNSDSYDSMYESALPELLNSFDNAGVKATFFIIGKDLQHESCRVFCKDAVARGHELGNHTYSHPINLHKLTFKEKEDEIRKCNDLLESTVNQKIVGFRAPGYYLDQEIIEILIELGYSYDSSVLPSYVNFLMKHYINWKSGKILDKAFGRKRYCFASPKIKKIYSKKNQGKFIYEIPIATAPLVRLPVHSTFLFGLGRKYFDIVFSLMKSFPRDYVYLFHGIDLFRDSNNKALADNVPTLRMSVDKRNELVKTVLDKCKELKFTTTKKLVNSLSQKKIPESRILSYKMNTPR